MAALAATLQGCSPEAGAIVPAGSALAAFFAAPYTVPAPCKSYAHCDISPQKIQGFFFKNHMDIKEGEIFKDFEVLCNELASCLNTSDA